MKNKPTKTVLRSKAEKMTVVEKMVAGFPEVRIEILIEEPLPNAEKKIWTIKLPNGQTKNCRSSIEAERFATSHIDCFCSPFHVNKINILWRGVRTTISTSK